MIAIVTGCASGIGKAIFEALIEQGYYVYGIDKNQYDLMALDALIQQPKQMFIADLAKFEDLDFCVNKILESNQKIDLIINNACFSNRGLLSQCSYEEFNEVLHTAVSAPYYLALKLQHQLTRGSSIINISSTRARQSQADTESYSASKGALESLTHAMAVSLHGLCRVNCIAPGWIDTLNYEVTQADLHQHPSHRIGSVQDIVRAVNYLKHPSNMFVNGETINVDGGMSKLMIYHNDEGWTFHD